MDDKANGEQGRSGNPGVEGLEQRFKRWRDSRKRGDHIPPELWEAAVGLAREHGVPRIANRLRLNAECLSRRMEGAASPTSQASKVDTADTEFVELFAAPAAVSAAAGMREMRECVIELENARGAKMRVELNGAGLAGLAHLCRGFWSAA